MLFVWPSGIIQINWPFGESLRIFLRIYMNGRKTTIRDIIYALKLFNFDRGMWVKNFPRNMTIKNFASGLWIIFFLLKSKSYVRTSIGRLKEALYGCWRAYTNFLGRSKGLLRNFLQPNMHFLLHSVATEVTAAYATS